MRRCFVIVLMVLWAGVLGAEPLPYRLDNSASRIEFTFDLEGIPMTGQVPVTRADVMIDFDDVTQSQVDVTLHVARATARVGFATDAMRGNSILAPGLFPEARFQSRRVTPIGNGARIEGDLTLRGVTRPVILDGAIFRKRGSQPDDLRDLVLIFEGALDRNEFGASGYKHLVAPQVKLRILVAIVAL